MNENEREFGTMDLEDILREFAPDPEELPEAEVPAEQDPEESGEELKVITISEEEEPALPEQMPVLSLTGQEPETDDEDAPGAEDPMLSRDTIRLGDLSELQEPETTGEGEKIVLEDTRRLDPIAEMPEEEQPEEAEPQITEEEPQEESREEPAEPETEDTRPPLVFRPKSRLRELKRDLIAGPEKRYYELSEIGVGKLQMAIFLCLMVILVSAAASILYAMGMVPQSRMRLMVFSQILAMLFGALLGSYQMLQGLSDLFHGRFTLNTMLTITFAACAADAVFCLQELRVPVCACFTLEVAMSLWAEYQRRTTEMGMMDTMRKAVRLDSVVKCPDYYDGKPGYLRGEGQVADFMDQYRTVSGPERVQSVYALLSLLGSIGIAVLAFMMHGLSMGVQIFSTTLLVAVPASFFISLTRPMAVLERRFHRLGTVLCGWRGIKELCAKGTVPLKDEDIFPHGSVKMNGVKFYGDRDPEKVIAYAAALMNANGGVLAPIFDQLLTSRNGIRYHAANLRHYGNGGMGGEINEEPILMGSLDFLKEMGVEIPEGIQVKQAVYVSIDGELSGLFAITYNRMKFAAGGITTLNGSRRMKMLMLTEDFMITAPFMKEKFGVNRKRLVYPEWTQLRPLREKAAPEDAPALALTTQDGLAPMAYAITGAKALRSAWNLGTVIHVIGGLLGMLIMAALAYLGAVGLLSPVHVLLYQLIWMIPGLLVTMWTKVL